MAIKEVKLLECEFEILGIRIYTTKAKYDMDLDTCKKLRLSLNNLETLQLVEMSGIYMTPEEMEGLEDEVEDMSDDLALQSQVRTYFGLLDESSPLYQRKKKEKVREYSQEYYSYIPSDWLVEFGAYHFKNFEGNTGIYDSYSSAQMKLIRDYFRSRSRMIFAQSNTSPILVAKPQKSAKLIAMMGNATDWEYNGTVDTGYRGNGHCSLGHALRYEHYAYSSQLSKSIIFGQTCMSDFFELDKAVIKEIIDAQNTLLKEIKIMSFILETDKYANFASEYGDVKEIVDWVDNVSGRSGYVVKHYVNFMRDFLRLRLPFTRSMMLKYKAWRKDYLEYAKLPVSFREYFAQEKFSDASLRKSSLRVVDKLVANNSQLMLGFWGHVVIKGQLTDHYNYVRYFTEIEDHALRIREQFLALSLVDWRRRLLKELSNTQAYLYGDEGRRLATQEEVTNNVRGLVSESVIPPDRVKYFLVLIALTEDNSYLGKQMALDESLLEKATEKAKNVWGSRYDIKKALDYTRTSIFEEDLKTLLGQFVSPSKLRPSRVSTKRVHSSEKPKSTANKEFIGMKYDFVKSHSGFLTAKEQLWFNKISTDDIENSKDKLFIENLYSRVLKRGNLPDEVNKLKSSLRESDADNYVPMEEMVEDLLKALDTGKMQSSHFVYKVIGTVKKTGTASEKQLDVIKKAYNSIAREEY